MKWKPTSSLQELKFRFLLDSTLKLLGITNGNGEFTIKNVPVGKHQIIAKFSTFEVSGQTIEVSSERNDCQHTNDRNH